MELNGLATNLVVKRNAPIKVTKNINKKDKLTNGTFGYIVDVDKENNTIWCKFDNDAGVITRAKSKKKCSIDKDAVPIKTVKETVNFTTKKKKRGN